MGIARSVILATIFTFIFSTTVLVLATDPKTFSETTIDLDNLNKEIKEAPNKFISPAIDIITSPEDLFKKEPTIKEESLKNYNSKNIDIVKILEKKDLNWYELKKQSSNLKINETLSEMEIGELDDLIPYQNDQMIVKILTGENKLEKYIMSQEQLKELETETYKIYYKEKEGNLKLIKSIQEIKQTS